MLWKEMTQNQLCFVQDYLNSFQVAFTNTKKCNKYTVKGKMCDVIIDSGSCENVVSKALVKALQLSTVAHTSPYKIGCIEKDTYK